VSPLEQVALPSPALPRTVPRGRLGRALDRCRAVTEQHARTFAFAAHLLPRELRAACYAVYAFCRRADDAVDEAPSAAAARLALQRSREELARAFGAEGVDDPDLEVAALAWAHRSHGVPRAPLEALLDGMALDLEPQRIRTWPELHRYCVLAAGTVGRALAPALGAPPEAADAAEALGVAMQLTNILRDVAEDGLAGRVYLPADELARAGLGHEELLAGAQGLPLPPRWRELVAEQIARAREWYARAEPGIGQLSSWRARLCVRVMGVLYGEILAVLEAQACDPLRGRAKVPFRRKLWLAAGCLFGRRLPGARAPLQLPGASAPGALRSDPLLSRDRSA
jgi:15-cis-phytoene synthase